IRDDLVTGVQTCALPISHDILTVLLLHREDPHMELADDARIVREVATYLQGGTHTSAQTLVNALDLVFAAGDDYARTIDRIANRSEERRVGREGRGRGRA